VIVAEKVTTDRQISALKPGDRTYDTWVDGARGLVVRTLRTGAKVFEVRYVGPSGARRRLQLGPYPELTLADAVKKAGRVRVTIVDGGDPAADRQAERQKARTGETLNDLAAAYFKAAERGLHGGRGRPKSPITIRVERSRYKRHIGPVLGGRRFVELDRSSIRQFMRALATEGHLSADSVASIGRTLSSMLAFAVHEERLIGNPALGVTRPLALQPRERMFSEDALRKIWNALSEPLPGDLRRLSPKSRQSSDKAPVEAAVALALRFALVTMTRRKDVALATWDEVDLQSRTWTIPGARHKSRRTHVVPLSPLAMSLLVQARSLQRVGPPGGLQPKLYVFPSPRRPNAPLSGDALTRALTRTCAEAGVPHGSPHDFRRTAATLLTSERGGIRRFIVSKLLAHTPVEGAAVTEVYDRNEYLSDKRRALEIWGDLLSDIISGRSGVEETSATTNGPAERWRSELESELHHVGEPVRALSR
jgi:integrase